VTALNRLVQDAGIAALAGLNLEATIQMCGRFFVFALLFHLFWHCVRIRSSLKTAG